MRCSICGKEKEVLDAIYEDKLVSVCEECARIEDVIFVKKPTKEQVWKSNQRATVHETMMKLSGLNKLRALGPDSGVAVKNMGKIKFPEKLPEPSGLVDNFSWVLRMARRREKYSLKQISEITKISELVLQDLEAGKVPKNYEEILPVLENTLGVKVLKRSGAETRFMRPKKFTGPEEELEKQRQEEAKQRQEQVDKIAKGDFNFSDKKSLQNVTLDDLRELKKRREQVVEESQDFVTEELDIDEEI